MCCRTSSSPRGIAAAKLLILLEKMDKLLKVTQANQARHLQRHKDIHAESIFIEADTKEIIWD